MLTQTTSPLRRARGAVTLAFLVHGLAVSAWVARIPQIKQELGLSEGALGVALLGAPVGVFFAVRVAGRAVARWGSRVTSLALGAAGSLVLIPLGLAWNLPSLIGALFLMGIGLGMMDVAMNAQGVAVERAYGRPIMSGLHGSYSVGTLIAALVGSGAAQLGVPVAVHLSVMALVLVAILLLGGRGMLGPDADVTPEPAEGGEANAGSAAKAARWTLLLLGVIGLCSFVGEGAMADWSGVYLREDLGTEPGVAGLGFAGCAVAMTIGRLTGDRVVGRFGPVPVLRVGSLVGAAGLALGLLAHDPVAAVAGFTLFGLGVAVVAPVTFSAAGNVPGVPAAVGIGRVTAIGYLGLLGGPPVIGFVAEGLGLAWALAVPALLAALIVPLAGATRTADR